VNAFGNVVAGYAGTVAFASNGPIAKLLPDYTFMGAGAGAHTFTAAITKAGTQFLHAADTPAGRVLGVENDIAVSDTPTQVSGRNGSQLFLTRPRLGPTAVAVHSDAMKFGFTGD
jgi:hypothetical protein